MNIKKYTVIVSSCDSYSDLWQPFFYLLHKFWPSLKEVILCTEFKSFPCDYLNISTVCKKKDRSYTWSELIYLALDEVKTEFVILILDDFWLKSKVKENIIDECVRYMEQNSNIATFNFMPQPGSNYLTSAYSSFERRGRFSKYKLSCQVGIWRVSYLQKMIRLHENPWQFECFGSRRAWRYNYEFYSLKKDNQCVFDYHPGGVLFRGKYVDEYIQYFKKYFNIPIDLSRGVLFEKEEDKKKLFRFSFSYWRDLYKSLIP